jgi:cold shock CspA family protein
MKEPVMEKGTITSFDRECGVGTISRASDADIRFYSENVIGKGRSDLAVGNTVIFEVDSVRNLLVALNVRKV